MKANSIEIELGVHNSQGSQLLKSIVHSDYEFTGGMLYVALLLVRSLDDVQVIGFRKDHIKSREVELAEIGELQNNAFVDGLQERSCVHRELCSRSGII